MKNQIAILFLVLHALEARTTMEKIFDNAKEAERKYAELLEVTAEIVNLNTNESSSNYVATIGVTDQDYMIYKLLTKISTTVSSPAEVHGLAQNAIIFAKNDGGITIRGNFDQIHRRGRIVVCDTNLYSNDTEVLGVFRKFASNLWNSRFSRMIFIAWIGEELNIFGIKPYDEKTCFPTELIKITKNGRINQTRPFGERIKNLNQCLLRIITTSGMPYAETCVKNNVTLVRGIEGNILDILSSRMNFSTLISDTEELPDFDSRFNDSKDLLRSNKSDLCFAGKKVNLHGIEPTVPIMDCRKIWVVPKSKLIPPWMQVIVPFEKSVWITLAFALSFIGVACQFLNEKTASLINMWSLFLGVSILMNKTKPAREDVKVFLVFWIFFSYVITRSYLASLGGYLTKPTFLPEIDTLDDLVSSGMPIEGHPIVRKLFCPDNETKTSKDICRRFVAKSVEAIFEDIKSRGKVQCAFTMKEKIYKNSKFLRDFETHVMGEILLQYPTAFLAQTGAPFLEEMNIIITRLIEAGFVDFWQRQEFLIQDTKKHYPEELRVEHISGIMFVATLGYTISIIVFCCECLAGYFDFTKLRTFFFNKNNKLAAYKHH